jgi:hypothetical protein
MNIGRIYHFLGFQEIKDALVASYSGQPKFIGIDIVYKKNRQSILKNHHFHAVSGMKILKIKGLSWGLQQRFNLFY